jgi:hypothetical protein
MKSKATNVLWGNSFFKFVYIFIRWAQQEMLTFQKLCSWLVFSVSLWMYPSIICWWIDLIVWNGFWEQNVYVVTIFWISDRHQNYKFDRSACMNSFFKFVYIFIRWAQQEMLTFQKLCSWLVFSVTLCFILCFCTGSLLKISSDDLESWPLWFPCTPKTFKLMYFAFKSFVLVIKAIPESRLISKIN